MKILKKTLSVILSIVISLNALFVFNTTAFAADVAAVPSTGGLTTGSCGENVTYSFDSTTGTLTISGTGDMTDYSSSSLSPFYNNGSIKTVVINDGVTSIGDKVFSQCNSLTSITICNGVTKLGDNALYNCNKLTNATMPDSLETIGEGAFFLCSALKNVSFGKSLTTIEDYAFGQCKALESISLPESLEYIGYAAFNANYSLVSIYVPKNVQYIGEYAIPQTLKSALESIEVDPENDYYCSENNVLYNKDKTELILCASKNNISTFKVPNTVKKIYSGAFDGCVNLVSVDLPEGITSIESRAFYCCTSLTSVTIPEGVSNIGVNVFNGCDNLDHIILPDSVTSIGNNAFSGTIGNSAENYASRFSSNSTVLPVAKSITYKNKIYARFDKPIANFNNKFSSYLKFAEGVDDLSLKIIKGIVYRAPLNYYAVGANLSGGEWIWQYSNAPVDTSGNWGDNQPNGGSETQLAIASSDNKYHDVSLSSTGIGFVASVDLEELNAQVKATSYYKTNKYVFYNSAMPFTLAKQIAQSYGGYLATITSSEEQSTIHNMIGGSYKAFLGGEKNSSGNWTWMNGEKFGTYTNWASGQPSNTSATGGQYFLAMLRSGTWDDCNDLYSSSSAETAGFVVEYAPSNVDVVYSETDNSTVNKSEISLTATYPDNTTAEIEIKSISITKIAPLTYNVVATYENERGEENTATRQIQLDESGQCGENAYYTYCGETKTLTISGSGSIYDYNNSAKYHFSNFYNDVEKLVIADGITKIGDNDFSECANLKEVDIPSSVTALGTDAFSGCSMLDNVILPDSLKTMGSYSFYRCSNLKQIIIPKGVESIGQSAFLSCSNLDSIIIYSFNADVFDNKSTLPQQAVISSCSGSTAEEYAEKYERNFVSIGHKYINETTNPTCTKDGYTKYTCTLCDYSFNDDVISAKGHSWNSGTVIQEATEENPVEITQYTCTECNEAYTVETEKAVEHIEHTYDVEITEPTCTEQGFSVYKCRYCDDTYTSDYTDALGHDFGSYVSDGNATTETDGTKTAVCSRCGITDTVTDEDSMIRIFEGECGESAYWSLNTGTGELRIYGSGQTTAYFILSTNKRPPWYNYKKYIKTVVIEEGITSIGSYFLAGCSTISKVYIPSTINSISTNALTNTSKVSEFIVDSENESFTAYNGDLYDKEKTSLIKYASGKNAETVILPGSVETIGAYAFYYCSNIEKICITGNLKAIGTSAFYSCTALTAVNLPNSIESIGNNAFNNCSAIENLYIANTQCSIYDNTGTIPANIRIYGYSDSTANQFADTYGNEFIAIEDCAHSFSETITEANCFTGGCTQYLCTLCGYVYYDGYTALTNEHILNDIVKTVEPTCIAEGYTVYRCEVCNKEIKADFTSVVEHSYQCVSAILPNCINNGVNYFKCTSCGDEYREEISSTGIHSYIGTVILPTCTDRGYTEYICSVCNDEYKADSTDTVSHSFGEYVLDDNSSEFFDGTKTRTCNVCGFKESINVSEPEIFSNYDESVIAGDTISIPVCIKNNTGVAGMALNFEYDSSVLTPLSVVGGELMQSGLNDNIEGDAKDGSFKAIWYSSSNMTDNGVLLYLNFEVNEKALGSTEIKISYESRDTFNESFDDVVLNCRNILIDIENDDATKWLNSSLKFVNQQSGALSENGCVTAGDVFCLSVDEIGYKSDLTCASYGITYDNKNFTFVGYADKYSHLVDTKAVDSNGSISILFSNNKTYNIKTPDEVFETLGIKYLMFKANDYSSAGDYVFEFNVTDAEGVDEVTSTNCTVTINASSVSEIANVYIENGISAKAGEEITVPINISNNKGLIGYLVNVSYNPEQIEIISAQKCELFPGNFNSTIGQERGRFFVLWNTTDNNTENGVLFYLKFKVLSEADVLSPISLSYSQDDTFNEDYCDVVFNCIDNTIHLNEEEQHSFVDEIVSPTAETKGYTLHTCISCGYSYTDCETDYLSDNSAICAALEKVTEYQAEDYSNNSYQLLQGLYFKYIDYPNKSLPQSEFDKAVFDLLTAISALEPYLNLNVSAPNGAFTVTYNDETNSNNGHSLLFGTNVTLNATANEGYEFVGWYDTINNRYFSKNPEYSFKLTTNTSLKAVFVKEQSATLTFTTYSNWVQSTVTKTIDEWNSVSSIDDLLPAVPYKYGYSNGRWVYDNAEVLAKLQTGENVSLIPEYDDDDTSLPTPPSPNGDTPVLDLYYNLDADANVGSFVMAAGIPEDCQLESVGIAFYYKNADEFDPTKFELLINNKMLAGRFNTDEIEDIYIVNMNKMSANYNWAARGYVTYYDSDANLKTVYSNQINIVNREQV